MSIYFLFLVSDALRKLRNKNAEISNGDAIGRRKIEFEILSNAYEKKKTKLLDEIRVQL